jgi:hypothetical protein
MSLFSALNFLKLCFDASFSIFKYLFKCWILRVPVSYPDGPRGKNLLREGCWPKKRNKSKFSLPVRYACDKRSHELTDSEFKTFPLTGESCGRQIWYLDRSGKSLEGEFDFSAAENPNSSDKLLRQQMIENWNGPKPDISKKARNGRHVHFILCYLIIQLLRIVNQDNMFIF